MSTSYSALYPNRPLCTLLQFVSHSPSLRGREVSDGEGKWEQVATEDFDAPFFSTAAGCKGGRRRVGGGWTGVLGYWTEGVELIGARGREGR